MKKQQDYVVHLTPVDSSMIASAKIAKFIAEKLRIPLIDYGERCEWAVANNPGIVFVVNGPPAFCAFRDELAQLFAAAKTVVWCQNDYTIYPPSQTNKVSRKRGWVNERGQVKLPYVLGTLPDRATTYINWNALTMEEPRSWGRNREGFVYYGAFRQGRADKFRRYLPTSRMFISAPRAARDKFRSMFLRHDGVNYIEPFSDLIFSLTRFEATVLIQDKRSDARYMSLPNRFYECLAGGLAQYISLPMVASLERAGYVVDEDWCIQDAKEIDVFTHNDHKSVAASQRRAWANKALAEKAGLGSTLKEFYKYVRNQLD